MYEIKHYNTVAWTPWYIRWLLYIIKYLSNFFSQIFVPVEEIYCAHCEQIKLGGNFVIKDISPNCLYEKKE